LSLRGTDQPAVFSKVTFNYVDKANSGQLAIHQFIFDSSIPLNKGCRVKIYYPADFTVTEESLNNVQGSGFFKPIGSIVDFTRDTKNNAVEVVACQKEYGGTKFGILTLTRVLNQPFKHDSGSFRIEMAEENDRLYSRVFQKLDGDLIVREDQQRAGEMSGTLVPSSTLVQTHAYFQIELRPTLDLSSQSYLKILIPDAVDIQGPSCAIREYKGFASTIYCSRAERVLTLYDAFD
jgi:hypothetical protein